MGINLIKNTKISFFTIEKIPKVPSSGLLYLYIIKFTGLLSAKMSFRKIDFPSVRDEVAALTECLT